MLSKINKTFAKEGGEKKGKENKEQEAKKKGGAGESHHNCYKSVNDVRLTPYTVAGARQIIDMTKKNMN